jgi:ATP-dependent helicase/nuclease subunit A
VSFVASDQAARERVRRDHDTSFVLEAGAGTGKTTLLVDRIEALVRSGRATLDRIAAVTFTENAATTMKLRLRERLERARADTAVPLDERRRASEALDILERAAISTIHALCAAILQEQPLECGVVPGFRVADEAQTDVLFAAAWEEWLAERLVQGDDVLLEAMDQGIPLEGEGLYGERTSLRGLARTLVDERDLEPLVAAGAADAAAWRDELLARTRRVPELTANVAPGDTLALRLQALLAFAEAARFLEGRPLERHLTALEVIPRNFGFKPKWPSVEILEEARAVAAWTKEAQARWASARAAALHGRLVRALQGVVALYERRKTAAGLLDFVDLLLKTRDALRDSDALRRHLRERFQVLIVDEFQDTDPLQVDIARRLSSERPGVLTVVGDAKQSIYRFRRAEVTLFRRLADEARAKPGHAVLHLVQNFRSRPAILRFVNRVFARIIRESETAGQPAYEPIDPPPGLGDEPAVIALRFEAPLCEGDDLLRAEAAALAALVARAAAGAYELRDPSNGAPRASRAGDVMVLARRLTQVRHLESAFEAAGLRFTVEGGKSFFDRQEVHETLAVLRAVDDPSDRVSLVAALRSTYLGVSDRDVVSYALSGGRVALLAEIDEALPGGPAIAPALRLLEALHRARARLSVPALVERLYDETRVLAALTGTRRGEARIANLEKVVSLARQAASLGVLTLRGFVSLLGERIENAREEPDLPATRPGDPTTVRVLSIHKAKGLEAPIVALYDAADDPHPRADVIPLWDEGRVALGFRGGCQPPRWDELKEPEEARAWAELRRLLYVACTRARDLLVIPVPPADARAGSFWRELTEGLPSGDDDDVRVVDAATLPVPPAETAAPDLRLLAEAEGGDAAAARWETRRDALVKAACERPFVPVPATRVAARTAPPPVVAGRTGGGRAFGSLVHRVMEWIPLDAPDCAAALAAALAPAFGVDADGARRAASAAERALALPVMERARRAARVWRELPLCFPDGDELVEGTLDLVFEEDGQLVLVDYKTDPIGEDQAIDQAAHHAPQLQLYGRGLAQASGQRVKERLVLFTTLGRVVQV